MFLYPLCITLILLALIGRLFNHDRTVYISVTICTTFAALFDLFKTLPAALQPTVLVELGRSILPWFDLNLGWVVPAVVGFTIGMGIHLYKKRK